MQSHRTVPGARPSSTVSSVPKAALRPAIVISPKTNRGSVQRQKTLGSTQQTDQTEDSSRGQHTARYCCPHLVGKYWSLHGAAKCSSSASSRGCWSSHLRCGINGMLLHASRQPPLSRGPRGIEKAFRQGAYLATRSPRSHWLCRFIRGVAYALPAHLPILRARSATCGSLRFFLLLCALRYSPSRSERSASTFATGLTVQSDLS